MKKCVDDCALLLTQLEPTINVGTDETHAEDQNKLYETEKLNKITRLTRLGGRRK